MDLPIDSKSSDFHVYSKGDILLKRLLDYYTIEKMTILSDITQGRTNLSLRIIDWFVTNYSKNKGVRYNYNGYDVAVYIDYKNQLRAFSKKMFDPFCRRKREEVEGIGTTTIGQMNFFKWAIEKGVLNYIFLNAKEIERSMNEATSIKNKKDGMTQDNCMVKPQEKPGFIREVGTEFIVKFN
tara:strand:- start:431 stop:976 length:546 start_codon:yes stop_codon:yes gene_type:complete